MTYSPPVSTPAEKIRVLVVDDHAVMCEGISALVEAQRDMVVVGKAANGEEAIAEFRQLQPLIAIVDVNLPDISGIEAMIAIRRETPTARFIMISAINDDRCIRQAAHAGAQAFLHKDMLRRELIPAIRDVQEGRQYFPPGFTTG